MRTTSALAILVTLASCASSTPAPRELRQFSVVEGTKLSQSEAYLKAMQYFTGSINDVKSAITMQDPQNFRFILKTNVICNELRQFGDIADYRLLTSLTFEVKPGKYRLAFEDMTMTENNGNPVSWTYLQLGSTEKVNQVQVCLKPIIDNISKALKMDQNW